jgi:biopolymer transport protein ExbD
MCDINTTPLIDVLLVLLVTLIITLPVMTHAVKLDLPQNQNPPPQQVQPEVIDLDIDFDGTVVWNGTPVSLQQLDGYFATESQKVPQPEIHLNPDGMAKYDVVAKVLASAQRNRMTKIGFVNVSSFAE